MLRALSASVRDNHLTVALEDGRIISVPLSWYPRLVSGTNAEREHVELGPFGLHWPDLDEDISIKGLLLGHKSGESSGSFKTWLEMRSRGERVPIRTLEMPEELANELGG
jgi:hypothetical protein